MIIAHAAPNHARDQAWSILDRLHFDPDVRPDWQAGPHASRDPRRYRTSPTAEVDRRRGISRSF